MHSAAMPKFLELAIGSAMSFGVVLVKPPWLLMVIAASFVGVSVTSGELYIYIDAVLQY